MNVRAGAAISHPPRKRIRQRTAVSEERNVTEGDRLLIERVLQGDPEAPEEFVQRYGRLIYSILHTTGLSEDEAKDLFQQVFVHLWERECRRLRQWQGNGQGRFGSYLGVLVTRLALDHRRRQKNTPIAVDVEEGITKSENRFARSAAYDPEEILNRREQAAALQNALRQLRERDANLLTLKYIDDNSYRQVADALGMTVGHVGVALHRAGSRLRRELDRTNPGFFDKG